MSMIESQCKRCRRAGEKLFLKGERCNSPKCALVKRNFPPGAHGDKGYKKLTNYGEQLKEKQKARNIYGLREKQFRVYFEKSFKKKGNTGEMFFKMLESRLDNTIFRLGLASSRPKARQLVSHGHFQVNDRKVDIPSFLVKIGDKITIKTASQTKPAFKDLAQALVSHKEKMVSWLNLDEKLMEGKVTGQPKSGEVEANVDWRAIVEFYSK